MALKTGSELLRPTGSAPARRQAGVGALPGEGRRERECCHLSSQATPRFTCPQVLPSAVRPDPQGQPPASSGFLEPQNSLS